MLRAEALNELEKKYKLVINERWELIVNKYKQVYSYVNKNCLEYPKCRFGSPAEPRSYVKKYYKGNEIISKTLVMIKAYDIQDVFPMIKEELQTISNMAYGFEMEYMLAMKKPRY